ncbi:MAG: sulfatase-like hydrolase/transferase [Chloroflexi bacterium]|nr:sulfatase-like hydrolase/transferase [Chloroflexota bacterium]
MAAVLCALSSPAAAPQARPNFLFLYTDDQRYDALSVVQAEQGPRGRFPWFKTPNLDRLAGNGLTFTRAIAAYPICVASRAEILTGVSCFRNGVPYGGGKLKPGLAFWADTLRQAGYRTWYVGKWHNDGTPKSRGYMETRGLYTGGGGGKEQTLPRDWNGREVTGYRGWTLKTDDGRAEPEKGVGLTPDISRRFADAAVELINRKPAEPFFLHVNFSAPHDPLHIPPGYAGKYDPQSIPLPANFLPEHPFDHGNLRGRDELLWPWPRTPRDVREELAVYYAVVEYMDAQIGRILAALRNSGQMENTIIIFSTDQGLAVGSHGLRGKQNLYEHTFNVPLIIGGPGIPKDRRLASQCYLRDLFPTTCELAGVEIPETVQGKSLAPVLTGKAASVYPHLVGYFTDTQRAIRTDRWKFILYPKAAKQQLFDLAADPNELRDLSAEPQHTAQAAALRATLETWLKQNGDPLFTGVR